MNSKCPYTLASFCAAVLLLLPISQSIAASPDLVPPGWKHEGASDRRAIHFVSPDGRATLTMRDVTGAATSPATVIGAKPGEQVTYRAGGRDWTVISGYRGQDIFYRCAGFACGHRRIHVIELNYPREQKRQLDATVTSISRRLQRYRDVCRRE